MRHLLPLLLLLLIIPVAALCQEQKKQPPPEFSTGYQPPNITVPGPRAEIFSGIDVAILVAVLALTTYFVMSKRSRRDVRVLVVFSVLYFGFYRHGCVCSIGAIQNVALSVGQNDYALPFAAGAFFLIPLVFALFFGRIFCAAACPLGAIQDVVLLRPRRIPVPVEHALGLVPYVYLGAAVLYAATGSAFIICQYDPFIAFFRLGGSRLVLSLGAGLLVLGTVIGRPYCRFLCPYGVLLRWVSPFSMKRVTITPTKCIQCHLCADACPFGAIKPPTPEVTLEARRIERRRLAQLILLLPVLLICGAWLGYLGGPELARTNHDVALAERVLREDSGKVKGISDASQAFRNASIPVERLYGTAAQIRRKFRIGGAIFGVWVGLVVGLKLISLSIRRRHEDYVADPGACLSCARCYLSCPVEHERLQNIYPDLRRIPLEPRSG